MTDEEIIEKVMEGDYDDRCEADIRSRVKEALRLKEQECENDSEIIRIAKSNERSRIKGIVEDMVKEYQDLALKTEDTLHLHGIGAVITGLEELLSKIGGEGVE